MIFFDTTEKKRARLAGYVARLRIIEMFMKTDRYVDQGPFLDLCEKIAILRYELGER